ncbi:hypothetical protein SAMN02745218_01200 [Desulfofundulus australicus DSM 11792]|uniref:Uncharacterized protein n=1 Tax=Desulfofundulus australicus DSM 11792 TaxID=1121425 RepID=A0A1M4XWS9_9FIRM|nr:hypothetical protein [Desulfofundulus australicus]SHE97941.1 hypothetical protein SAMN02745218_01200 [Desulfofundulus australicus DSM 11792]
MDEKEFEFLKEKLLWELRVIVGGLFVITSVALIGGYLSNLIELTSWSLVIITCVGTTGFLLLVEPEELGRWGKFVRYAVAKVVALLQNGLGRLFKPRRTYGLTNKEIAGKYLDFAEVKNDEGDED